MGEGLNKINFKSNPTILKYVPHRHRATYLDSHDLRSSTPTTYVPQRLAARACLEAQFITFGGSIRHVWRLQTLSCPKRLYLSAFQGFALFTLRLFCGYHRRELGSFAYFSLNYYLSLLGFSCHLQSSLHDDVRQCSKLPVHVGTVDG